MDAFLSGPHIPQQQLTESKRGPIEIPGNRKVLETIGCLGRSKSEHFHCRALDIIPVVEESPPDTQGVIVNGWHPMAPEASRVQNSLSSGEMFP